MCNVPMTPRGKSVLRLLNRREKQVLVQLCTGLGNRQIAARIGTTEQCIKNTLGAILKKAGAENRQQLVIFAWSAGIVTCPCEARRQFLSTAARTASERLQVHPPRDVAAD